MNTKDLRGQSLIDWWQKASDHDKDILILERLLGYKRFKGVTFGGVYLWRDAEGAMFHVEETSDPVTQPGHPNGLTSSRMRLCDIAEMDGRVTSIVQASGWVEGLKAAIRAKTQDGYDYSDDEMLLNCAAADADTRALGWLLALGGRNAH